MSMSPGINGDVTELVRTVSSGKEEGATSTMRSPWTNTSPGSTISPRSTSSSRELRSRIGCCSVTRGIAPSLSPPFRRKEDP